MLLLLHGNAGTWDEIAIAVAAFVVLWVAVKLAGRKPAEEDEAEDEVAVTEPGAQAVDKSAQRPASR